jgi:hypothetical protein
VQKKINKLICKFSDQIWRPITKIREKKFSTHWCNTWYWMQPCHCDGWMVIKVNILSDCLVYKVLKGPHYTWEANWSHLPFLVALVMQATIHVLCRGNISLHGIIQCDLNVISSWIWTLWTFLAFIYIVLCMLSQYIPRSCSNNFL